MQIVEIYGHGHKSISHTKNDSSSTAQERAALQIVHNREEVAYTQTKLRSFTIWIFYHFSQSILFTYDSLLFWLIYCWNYFNVVSSWQVIVIIISILLIHVILSAFPYEFKRSVYISGRQYSLSTSQVKLPVYTSTCNIETSFMNLWHQAVMCNPSTLVAIHFL